MNIFLSMTLLIAPAAPILPPLSPVDTLTKGSLGEVNKVQNQSPLVDCVKGYSERNWTRFTCPGHKGRSLGWLDRDFSAVDLTNLPATDSLHSPSGAILAAEKLLAHCHGARYSFLLVGGSTVGNQAALLSCTKPGDKVLMQRNGHKSLVGAAVLCGLTPVWLIPELDADSGIAHGISAEQLRTALTAHPDAVAVVLLNPTYYGTAADIDALVAICRERKKISIVDQAHGAHFLFHPELPRAAEDPSVQADFVIQSYHKNLPCFSQGAVLHVNSCDIDEESVRRALQMLQTTSPSYPIMASIDYARRTMAQEGEKLLTALLTRVRNARTALQAIPGVKLLSAPELPQSGSGFYALDETKLVIDTAAWGISGYELMELLSFEDNPVQPELAGPSYILCLTSIYTTEEDLQQLVTALQRLQQTYKHKLDNEKPEAFNLLAFRSLFETLPEAVLTPRDAFFAPAYNSPLQDAAGKVCAEIITPYPPGIPLLMPGERIELSQIEYLLLLKQGGRPVSCSDPTLQTIKVVK